MLPFRLNGIREPNATRQARREAGAERTLYAVACTRVLGAVLVQTGYTGDSLDRQHR
jgi:hypothetical protein